MPVLKMEDIDLRGKRVMIREDFNVPMRNGHISSTARLMAALPTIQYALQAGAKVILLSHLGRPTEGEFQAEFSLAPIAEQLSQLLHHPVTFVQDWLIKIPDASLVLCENVRFNPGEKNNDDHLAQQMAKLCDVFVMDAFATAHRAEASTYGIAKYAPIACAGPLLMGELMALSNVLAHPARPLVAIVGGSKVSSKLIVLEKLLSQVDTLIVGGGIANTFLAAQGYKIGASLYEAEFVTVAQQLLAKAQSCGVNILLPTDVVVGVAVSADTSSRICSLEAISDNEKILDVGTQTVIEYAKLIQQAGTILWNGPVGVFELEAFSKGTCALAHAIAQSKAFSVAGGGDTIAAIEKFNVASHISYISTGGGAFLEFIEGKILPAVDILQKRAQEK